MPTERAAGLAAENRRLQARLAEVTQEATRNEQLLRKTHERELDLLRAATLPQLLERLVKGLRTSYQLDVVTLTLHDPQHELRNLLWGDRVLLDALPQVQFVDVPGVLAPICAAGARPWLGPYSRGEHAALVPESYGIESLALIPLCRGEQQADGVLAFGSVDPQRFTASLASDFLEHLGLVTAFCLENAVNRARLLRSGLTDYLTGFHNRRYLSARLREELARAQRFRQPVACLMIDVDHFKQINDQFGHLAGDTVLREVARRIDTQMRLSDVGARFGGDEFAIILPQGTHTDGERVAGRVLDAVRGQPVTLDGALPAQTLTLSIGVAVAEPTQAEREHRLLAERLLAAADAALYRAKSGGRNQVVVSRATVS